mmetsp:Transcript_11924/g.27470  ORF Transcript_11924/g.27470 Transcript_11924/m.27470 type:complete len:274 (-) Transcript_11924:3069-3890(-)
MPPSTVSGLLGGSLAPLLVLGCRAVGTTPLATYACSRRQTWAASDSWSMATTRRPGTPTTGSTTRPSPSTSAPPWSSGSSRLCGRTGRRPLSTRCTSRPTTETTPRCGMECCPTWPTAPTPSCWTLRPLRSRSSSALPVASRSRLTTVFVALTSGRRLPLGRWICTRALGLQCTPCPLLPSTGQRTTPWTTTWSPRSTGSAGGRSTLPAASRVAWPPSPSRPPSSRATSVSRCCGLLVLCLAASTLRSSSGWTRPRCPRRSSGCTRSLPLAAR